MTPTTIPTSGAYRRKKTCRREKIAAAMERYGTTPSHNTKTPLTRQSLGVDKPLHISETGWASASNELIGRRAPKPLTEYKSTLLSVHARLDQWCRHILFFTSRLFDSTGKTPKTRAVRKNHFGLFTIDRQVKYAVWDLVDKGVFGKLRQGGQPISKTYGGDKPPCSKKSWYHL